MNLSLRTLYRTPVEFRKGPGLHVCGWWKYLIALRSINYWQSGVRVGVVLAVHKTGVNETCIGNRNENNS